MKFFYILKKFVGIFVNKYRLFSFQYNWRLKNPHNETVVMNLFPINLVRVGKFSYGPLIVYSWNTENESLTIGDFCSIASGVKFILGGNHRMNYISTFPFKHLLFEEKEAYSNGGIILEDDVWLGSDVTILSGVKLGKGCVVAAGSVVAKSFPEYSIIGGVPAKVIGKRFSDEIINLVKEIDYSKLEKKDISENLDFFYSDVEEMNKIDLENRFTKLLEK